MDTIYLEGYERFAYEEAADGAALDKHTQHLAILAVLIGCGGVDEYRHMLDRALKDGFSPVSAKEIVYQATAYLGMGRVRPFLAATNGVMQARGVSLPLPDQSTTTPKTRREKGTAAQVAIFGEGMRDFWQKSAMNRWLAAHCFGDHYTRTGLTLAERELITFCFLYAHGGCEPQLMSHITGNFNVGNDAELLQKAVYRCVPWIGYPRSLNALSCIQKAIQRQEDERHG